MSEEEVVSSSPSSSCGGRRQWLLSALVSLSSVTTGVCIALTGVLIPELEKEGGGLRVDLKEDGSVITTLWLVSGLVSSPVAGAVADWAGRKPMLVWSQPLFALSFVLIALAKDLWFVYAARVASGVANGMSYSIMVVYISEIAHPDLRGTLVNLVSIMSCFGVLLTYALGALVPWRTLNWILVAPPAVSGLLMITLLPETPSYLVSSGQVRKAKEVLATLRDCEDVTGELDEIVERRRASGNGDDDDERKCCCGGKAQVMASPAFLRPFCGVGVTFVLSNLAGVPMLFMYIVNVFQQSGTTIDPYLSAVAVASLRLAISCCSSVALKRFRRIPLFVSSSLVIAACNFALAGSSYARSEYLQSSAVGSGLSPATSAALDYVPLVSVLAAYSAYSFGYSAVIRVLCGEVFPLEIRSLATNLSYTLATMSLALTTYLFPYSLEWVGFPCTFAFFGAATLVTAAYARITVPESSGRTLANIEQEFRSRERQEE